MSVEISPFMAVQLVLFLIGGQCTASVDTQRPAWYRPKRDNEGGKSRDP